MHVSEEDALFAAHVTDLSVQTKKTGRPVFSRFLSEKEQFYAERLLSRVDVNIAFYGGYPDAERKILSLCVGDTPEATAFPAVCLKIAVTNKNALLKHSDYMGAVMALGVKREAFGDIVAFSTEAFIFVLDKLSDYFIENLTDVGRDKCRVFKVDSCSLPDFGKRFEDIPLIITSDRLDCFVSSLCRLSRDKSAEAIKGGRVTVCGIEVTEPSKRVNEGDIVVIRGFGKFIIGSEDGRTHKDRHRITVKKYN